MRYPRNAKIFRGQLDIAPIACVLFLLLMFVLLSSRVYVPGIPYKLTKDITPSGTTKQPLTITREGKIIFAGKTNTIDDLGNLKAEFEKLPPHSSVLVNIEPFAPREVVIHVQQQTNNLPIRLEMPGIQPPVAETWSSTQNRTIMVAVDLGGQYFYQNQLISEENLRDRLQRSVLESKDPLTLVVLADGLTQQDVLARLAEMAAEVGVAEWMPVVRPKK